jgi:hypothetical protein
MMSDTAKHKQEPKQDSKSMKINRLLALAGVAAAICVSASLGMAQDAPPGGGPGGGGRGNFDPAQMRQRMMDNLKEQLEVTDDSEWKALEPMITKVMELRMSSMRGGMGAGMFRRNRDGNNDGGQRRGGPPQSAESEALQKAIEGKASNAELKAAIAKYAEARKVKQAELEKAQADLRKVLTVRQEAILTVNGML